MFISTLSISGIDNPGFYEDGHIGEDDVGELEPNTPQV